MDGPVPMGKIVRQRSRRYKKVLDDAYFDKASKDVEVPKKFNSNKITPGTVFMSRLRNRLANCIKVGMFSTHVREKSRFKVFLSDSNSPGEGEQKIMNFVRKGKSKPNGLPPNVTIYGLDADLIVLSMTLERHQIKLLREPQNDLIHAHEFMYFDVSQCTDAIFKQYNLERYERNRVVMDFVFLTFFGGNDFVDPFVHTKMRDNGLDILLCAYCNVLHSKHEHILFEDGSPCFEAFSALVHDIASTEASCAKRNYERLFSDRSKPKNKNGDRLAHAMELYEHTCYTNKHNPFHKLYGKECCTINYKLPHETWTSQYNDNFFPNDNTNEVCMQFILCLKWTRAYYATGTCPSWLWSYKYRNAPLASTLDTFLTTIGDYGFRKLWDISFPSDTPLAPLEQLLAVTPPQHAYVLPFFWSKVITDHSLQKLFPRKVVLDVTKGYKNIYSEPHMDVIDISVIQYLARMLPLSDSELQRNVISHKLCVT